MIRKILILKESATRITVHPEYLHIKDPHRDVIIGFTHISTLYLNKSIPVNLHTCYEICKKVPVFIIDANGYIIAELKRLSDETV